MARYILGSRSPRRLELLQLIVPAEEIAVVPPASATEPDFEGLQTWDAIRERLLEIARGKRTQVLAQLTLQQRREGTVIAADTVIIASRNRAGMTPFDPPLVVLGQPPDEDSWRDVVRRWFIDYYSNRTHLAATAVCIAFPDGRTDELVTVSQVTMGPRNGAWLDWYLSTGEPRGKAGGYALQGAASVFIERVEGSLSNVVGLPLESVMDQLGFTLDA